MGRTRCTITIGPVNLRQLKNQKARLNEVLSRMRLADRRKGECSPILIEQRDINALKGIIHLLDHIQDTAEKWA